MIHLDLFSGYGGFALATEAVWPEIEHIFCDNDDYCQRILKKHWPDSLLYADIKELTAERIIADAPGVGKERSEQIGSRGGESEKETGNGDRMFILTGGFPCQSFSQAGKRKGTADARWLWPEMFRLVQELHPSWIIAENVRGLLTMQGGLVFENVCVDMESEGYEVQPFIIPACAVNAPHRRDRIWIVAHAECNEQPSSERKGGIEKAIREESSGTDNTFNATGTSGIPITPHPTGIGNGRCPSEECGIEKRLVEQGQREGRTVRSEGQGCTRSKWEENWYDVALRTCVHGVHDGPATVLDGYSASRIRQERIKACGNGIVPQVAVEIMKAIKSTHQ